MFLAFDKTVKEINASDIDENILTAGYVSVEELRNISSSLGFAPSTVENCTTAAEFFRSGVEVYDEFTFTELRTTSKERKDDDCVALYIKKNLFLVVDVADTDGSIKQRFTTAAARYTADNVTLEKLIFAFFDTLVAGDVKKLEETGTLLSQLEESLIKKSIEKDFTLKLLEIKKSLLRDHNYYEQILDITDEFEDNENNIFDSDNLMYISNISKKAERLREDTDSLKNTVEHLQDAYSTYLDTNLNSTMKTLTVLSGIFFPLTIIVGWYGMNFRCMPELEWRYGYLYVILLSLATVILLLGVGKKKKWF